VHGAGRIGSAVLGVVVAVRMVVLAMMVYGT